VPPEGRPIGLRFERVEKRYGSVQALRNLSVTVEAGECVAIAGRNGSGKTTLLRVAARLTRPSRGQVSYSGLAENEKPTIGFVAHATMVYDELSARENLLFFARLEGLADARARVSALLDEVGLLDRQDSLVRTFSRGMRQRVAIARALLARPSFLLFDEPGTGLDAESNAWLAERLRGLRDAGCTIVMSLHGESELARLASRAMRLEAGSLVSDTRSGATFQSIFAFTGA
jgi:heme exporter protein A